MEKPTETNTDKKGFSSGVDSASGSIHRVIDSAAQASSPAIKHITDSAHETVDKMANGMNHAAEAVSKKGVQLQHLQQQMTEGTRNQVRNHPLVSLGVALAGGMLFSWWLSRRTGSQNGA
ncbi:hypothetical protein P2G88_11910 [Aliiglaciecola sp. CAU 1673]|uniref:hypothetical protein n=1 Tax=Aliiglaciecola sp. CAU 1673 TaxID=3032595 RepID=UPI0023DC7409|nr:hypothetical protein [Aliiglaciecola sp. CAU 1673]MDF2178956.1 hypothetical protein [Aliiglaciecola sp. CAU 1673]